MPDIVQSADDLLNAYYLQYQIGRLSVSANKPNLDIVCTLPEGELQFVDDHGSFLEFLDMEVEGGDWGPEGNHHYPDPIERPEPRMDQAGGPPRPPPHAAENAANSRPSLCNNFIDDYKVADVLKKNGLPRLRIFIVGVLGRSRTKVSLTETRFVSFTLSCAESLYMSH